MIGVNLDPRLNALVTNHPGVVGSAAVFAFSVLHVLLVSRFDTSTALALFAVSDRFSILTSTFATLLSSIALGVAAALAPYWRKLRDLRRMPPAKAAGLVFVVFLLLTATLSAPRLAVAILGGFIVVSEVSRWRAHRRDQSRKSADQEQGASIASSLVPIYVVLVLFTSLLQPWVPQENFRVAGHVSSGFIFGSEGRSTYVLIDQTIVIASSESVGHRQICVVDANSWYSRRLIDFSDYPSCTEQQLPKRS